MTFRTILIFWYQVTIKSFQGVSYSESWLCGMYIDSMYRLNIGPRFAKQNGKIYVNYVGPLLKKHIMSINIANIG